MSIAGAHVLQPVLDQPHRAAEAARQMAGEHGVLDAALDPVAAADVDVVVHPHGVTGQAQRTRDLIGIFWHLDRGPDIENAVPRIPGRNYAEGLDRNRGAAPPRHAEPELARAVTEVLRNLAPHEGAVE
jgi:hypothetical protein